MERKEKMKLCKTCHKEQGISSFIRKGKEYKMCNVCSFIRKKERQSNPNNRDINLVETIDKKRLNFLIINHKSYDIGKSFINNKLVDGKAQLTLLANYHKDLNQTGEVKVGYYQLHGFGRYIGNKKLQLQNLSRKIRHTVCDKIYYDIDIKNAHPTCLSWYCHKNGIPCEGLDYYIENREECLKDIMTVSGLPRDEIKNDLLAIINGRVKTDKKVKGYPLWFITYYNNIQGIQEKVAELNPEFRKVAVKSKVNKAVRDGKSKDKLYNVDGTCISYLMQNLENIALMAMYDVCKSRKIRVGSLNYDGMMIYKESILEEELPGLFKEMQDKVFKTLPGCKVKIVRKEMNEGYDLSKEMDEYTPVDLSPLEKFPNTEPLFKITPSDYITVKEIPETVEYVEDLDWDGNKVLCINAPMGRGKTSSICRWIEDNNPQKVLVLSPRISYAKSIANEYNEKIKTGERFVCYKNVSDTVISTANRLVISMEGLHKLSYDLISKFPYDLVVNDECQANLTSHTCVNTNKKNFDNNWFHFNTILRNAKKILFTDAFINDKTCDFLTNLELDTTLLSYQMRMKKRTVRIIQDNKDYNTLLPYIYKDLEKGKRLYVVMSSATRLQNWVQVLQKRFPDKNILSYFKGTGKNIKDVRKEWSVADAVFTTTTITVGINYDIPDYFHRCYMSFSSNAENKIVDLFQSHYRVRHLKDNLVIAHIINKKFNIEWKNIDQFLITRNLKWFENCMIKTYELFEEAPDYLKDLLCSNQLEINLSKEVLNNCVYAFFKECNYDIIQEKKTSDLEDDKEELVSDMLKDWISNDPGPFQNIPLISRDEFISLSKKKITEGFLMSEDLDKISKYKFMSFFTVNDPGSWIKDNFETVFWEMWNGYHKTRMNNIKNEKKVDSGYTIETLFEKQYHKNQIGVMNDKSILKLKKIKELLKDLGLKKTQEQKTIPYTVMKTVFNKIHEQENQLRSLFDIPDQRKDKSKPLTEVNYSSILNSIFKDFGYTKINKLNTKRNKKGEAPYSIEINTTLLKQTGLLDFINEDFNIGMELYSSLDVVPSNSKLLSENLKSKMTKEYIKKDIQFLENTVLTDGSSV